MTQVQSYSQNSSTYSPDSQFDKSAEYSNDIRRCIVRRWDDYPGFGLHLSRTSSNAGVVVSEVEQGSPASACGLLSGDRIIEINSIEVENKPFVDILQILQNELKFDEVEFLVASASTPPNTNYKQAQIVRRETPVKGITPGKDVKRSDAMMIASLVGKTTGSYRSTPVIIERQTGEGIGISVSPDADIGHIISDVSPGSPADRANIKRGDVIIQIGDDVVLHLPYKKLIAKLQSLNANRIFLSVAPKDIIMRCALEHVPILTQYDTGKAAGSTVGRGPLPSATQYKDVPGGPPKPAESVKPSYPLQQPQYQGSGAAPGVHPSMPYPPPSGTGAAAGMSPSMPYPPPAAAGTGAAAGIPPQKPYPPGPVGSGAAPAMPPSMPYPPAPAGTGAAAGMSPSMPYPPPAAAGSGAVPGMPSSMPRPPATLEEPKIPAAAPSFPPRPSMPVAQPGPAATPIPATQPIPAAPAMPVAPPPRQPEPAKPLIPPTSKPAEIEDKVQPRPTQFVPPLTQQPIPELRPKPEQPPYPTKPSPKIPETGPVTPPSFSPPPPAYAQHPPEQQPPKIVEPTPSKTLPPTAVIRPPSVEPKLPSNSRHLTILKEAGKPVGFQLKTLNQEGNKEKIHAFGDIMPGLAADEAGVREGDKILRVNDVPVAGLSHQEVLSLLKRDVPKLEVDVVEDLAVKDSIQATSGPEAGMRPPSTSPTDPRMMTFSIAVNPDNPSIGLRLTKDMVIQSVEPHGSAASGGLRRGDVVSRINGTPVTSAEHQQAFHALRQAIASGHVELTVVRKPMVEDRDSLATLPKPTSPAPVVPPPSAPTKQISEPKPTTFRPTSLVEQKSVGPRTCVITGLVTGSPIGISLKDNKNRPAEITRVTAGSPADRAGLHIRDYVLKVNGKDASKSKFQEVKAMISASVPSGTLQLEVINEDLYDEYKGD